ncbi:hypothetical protein TBR22_A00480 [Luteitalea sp. TBR-22]|uniref:hypothetical protein n=1 Tax=Luteitalea sp. TBR-22 TaxID=2802971 RepID=UPI001AF28C22|nr:hypothetical protein [Luteitalea sp. TBR-22]BCS30848.1 hypothetical protein TBR22_A00480 [Luteitalea sp. TBR-22]
MINPIILFTCIAFLAALGVANAQEAPPDPGVVSSDTPRKDAPPVTRDERWRNYVNDAFLSPGPYFATVMPALGEQRRNQPAEYGEGWSGFGNRLVRRAAQYQLQTALYHSSAAALGTETGYRRCTCTGGVKRLGYALSRTFLTRTGSGRTVPNVAYIGGVFGGGAIATETWYPDRYRATGEGVRAGAIQVGVNTAVNVVQEFGPELKRFFRR